MSRRALCLALTLLLGCGGSDDAPALRGEFSSDVERCRAQLDAIYDALRAHHAREGALPRERDARFLAALLWAGDLPEGEASAELLSCCGTQMGERRMELARLRERWSDAEAVRADWSAYAVRDFEAHPLAQFPSGGPEPEPLIACDNAHGQNHAGLTNLLRSDGSIVTYDLQREVDEGRVPVGTRTLVVGPDSPLPELRKLRAGRAD